MTAPGPPLCPAGHLPLKGGDWQFRAQRPSCDAGDWRKPSRYLISPLEGEMSGRTERGAWAPSAKVGRLT
ncbi:lytic murein transglycosylase [Mesorhizobium sp. M2A.F.Ca.ET.042.01.1.1]|nr:lytic murein transglycosylase [Mesorhizobium sp. M2A.F.Ca.ET.042.01.1.1]